MTSHNPKDLGTYHFGHDVEVRSASSSEVLEKTVSKSLCARSAVSEEKLDQMVDILFPAGSAVGALRQWFGTGAWYVTWVPPSYCGALFF